MVEEVKLTAMSHGRAYGRGATLVTEVVCDHIHCTSLPA